MNHQQLVEHYAKLLEAKDREEQRAIEELDKPRNKQQDSAFLMQSVTGSASNLWQMIIQFIALDLLLFLEIKE